MNSNSTTWQPIETAPKDGSVVIGWHEKWQHPETIDWDKKLCIWMIGCVQPCYQPTFWMPLPASPFQPETLCKNAVYCAAFQNKSIKFIERCYGVSTTGQYECYAKPTSPRTLQEELVALDQALDEFTKICRARLHEMANKGKRGWDDPQYAKDIAMDLHDDAHEAALNDNRLHLHDIANRAMMLWWQEYQVKRLNG